jgi:hypothetical protein
VISKLCRGKSLEARIMDLVFTSASHEQLLEGFEALGREIGELIEEDNPDGWEDILTGDNI